MSTRCIKCVLRERTASGMFCDRCNNLERITDLALSRTTRSPDIEWLIRQVEIQDDLIAKLAGGVADLQRQLKARLETDPRNLPHPLEAATVGEMYKRLKEHMQ